MKPNVPNSDFGKKTFAKLPNLSIVGNSVSQNFDIDRVTAFGGLSEFATTNPSLLKRLRFKYEDFTPEQLEQLKGDKGDKGDRGDRGERGEDGVCPDCTPPVSGQTLGNIP